MAAEKHTTPTQLPLSFTPPEEWRPVVGYEGLYEVSNLGRVRSLERQVYSPFGASKLRWQKGRILRPSGNTKDGRHYLNVSLCKNAIVYKQEIHVIVLSTFIGPRPDGYVVNHRDGNRKNNMLLNLEWTTDQGNRDHARENGLMRHGEEHYLAKLTEQDVREIRNMAARGLSYGSLGRQFGVTPDNIRAIVLRISWKHIP